LEKIYHEQQFNEMVLVLNGAKKDVEVQYGYHTYHGKNNDIAQLPRFEPSNETKYLIGG
jgi:hypothetical protein